MRFTRIAALLLLAALLGGCYAKQGPTSGTMPPPRPDGQVDDSAVPDFVAVADRDGGIAGFVRKTDMMRTPQPGGGLHIGRGPAGPPITVYGPDLQTIVGRMYEGIGFVPLGVDPGTIPTFAVSTP